MTLATVSFQRGKRGSWHPLRRRAFLPGESPRCSAEATLTMKPKSRQKRGDMSAALSSMGSLKLTKVFSPPYSINSRFPTLNCIQTGDWNHAMFHCPTRSPTRTYWTTISPPLPEQLQPMKTAFILTDRFDSHPVRHSCSIPANHMWTNGKRRAWGCFRIFCESGVAESLLKHRRKWTCATCDTFLGREWGT